MNTLPNGVEFETVIELSPEGSLSRNAYTRGLSTGFGNSPEPSGPDVQILAPFEKSVCLDYLSRLGGHVAYGGDVRDCAHVKFGWYPHPVFFKRIDANYVRAVFADKNGYYPWEPLCDSAFAQQM